MERLTVDTTLTFCDIAQCSSTQGGSNCEDGYCDQRRVYERLREYERTGLEPEEVVALNNELDTAKEAICQMCRKCSEEQHFLCACVSCKYGEKQHGA